MKNLINTQIGLNRGNRRIWLEGVELSCADFTIGDHLKFESKKNRLIVSVTDEVTKNSVSKRTKKNTVKPLVELKGDVLSCFDLNITKVRVVLHKRKFVITPHAEYERKKAQLDRLFSRVTAGKPLRTLSLFCGAGFLDRAMHDGLTETGLIKSKIGVAVEMESTYLNAFISNNPDLFDEESIAIRSTIEDLDCVTGFETDIAVIALPCDGASLAGKAKLHLANAESHPNSGAMFFYSLDLVRKSKPPIVLIENVVPYSSSASMAVVRNVLTHLGYDLFETTLKGADYDAIENRERMCFVAMLSGLSEYFDISMIEQFALSNDKTVSSILEPIPHASDRWKSFDYLVSKEQRDIQAKKGFRRQLIEPDMKSVGCIGKYYAKCRSTEPFLVHPNTKSLSRIFTAVEHCRLKNAPEFMIQGLSETRAHEVLGQSVIYTCFKAVGMAISQAIMKFTNGYANELQLQVA